MPITATCTGCGKSLKVKDELKGKTIRCPACKTTFVAGAGAAAAGPLPTGRTRASTLGQKRDTKGPAFTISPAIILGGLLVVALVGGGIWWAIGPSRVHSQWDAMSGDVYDQVSDTVDFCLKAETSTIGSYNPRKAIATPKVQTLSIMGPNLVAFSMPEEVPFTGVTSEGEVKGHYHPATKEIDMDLDIGGTGLITGVVSRKGSKTIHCTGRETNGKVTAEINGKPAAIYTPPIDPDDK